MKVKTSEASGPALDWAVGKCEGKRDNDFGWWWDNFKPSTDWSQGGPIIERENIALYPHGDGTYEAEVFLNPKRGAGPTPLIAAMRCYVASKLGNEVEVPDELA